MRRAKAGSVMLGLVLSLVPVLTQAQRGSGFPHGRHQRLFPTCASCHAGIETGDAPAMYPSEATCTTCHNGTDARRVTWRRPAPAAGLLRFSHPVHASRVDSAGRACVTCHDASGGGSMNVRPAHAPTCLGCHAHRATGHLAADNNCATCHVALTAATGLSRQRVAALPRPPSHDRPEFVSAHDPRNTPAAASCAVCHARESCARCHVNAGTLAPITALAQDARVAAVVANTPPVYPVPADHRRDAFVVMHGAAARENVERCASCHARPSCTTCHVGSSGATLVRRVPMPEEGGAVGVRLVHRTENRRARSSMLPPMADAALPGMLRGTQGSAEPRVVRVHDLGFRRGHGPQAASGALNCAGCHAQRFCSDCHAGEGTRRFHAANFAVRHAADAYGRQADCASCHNTEAFCRSCHQQSGLASRGRLNVAFHDAQPQWLLQHGRAARQGLQNCASCHQQRDCLTCHATTGWGVNPHGPGFDAASQARRAPVTCLACHLEVPRRR